MGITGDLKLEMHSLTANKIELVVLLAVVVPGNVGTGLFWIRLMLDGLDQVNVGSGNLASSLC